jgi:hypothetical protein
MTDAVPAMARETVAALINWGLAPIIVALLIYYPFFPI